jgi:hypothetical protein
MERGQFSERDGHRMNVSGTWLRKVDTAAVGEQGIPIIDSFCFYYYLLFYS